MFYTIAETETVYHLFYECLLVFFFGKTLKTSGLYFQVKMKNLRYKNVYIGKLEKCELLNYLITLAKLHIWQNRKQDKIPEFS